MTYKASDEERDKLIWQLWKKECYTIDQIYEIFRVKMGDIDRIINEQREEHIQAKELRKQSLKLTKTNNLKNDSRNNP